MNITCRKGSRTLCVVIQNISTAIYIHQLIVELALICNPQGDLGIKDIYFFDNVTHLHQA